MSKDCDCPGPIQRAVNVVKAGAKWVAAGGPKASNDLRKQRYEVCVRCDRFAEGWCQECGCYLPAKVAMVTERCPLGLWER